MNSVTARALEVKNALDLLYKYAEEAVSKKEDSSENPKPKKPNVKFDKQKAKDTNGDDDILSGGAARFFDWSGTPWSMARAGKATTLAKAMGQEVSPSVSHPNTSMFVDNLVGGGLGALTGAGIGKVIDSHGGAVPGAVIGGGLGLLGSFLANGIDRTREIKRIRSDYNDARRAGTQLDLNAANPNLSRWGALLPFGGAHRSGSVDALEQLAGREPHSSPFRQAGRVAQMLPYVNLPSTPIAGAFEGYDAAARNQKLISELEKGGSAGFAARLGYYNGTMHKRAFLETLKGLGNQALDTYKGLDPTAQAAILGGGAGAAVGGVGNALFGKRKKGVGILGRLGRGALAGGGIGALGGAGINEAGLRMGMDTDAFGPDARGRASAPVGMVNDYISGLANKMNYPEDVQPR